MSSRPTLQQRGLFHEVLETCIFVIVVFVLVEMALPRFLVDGRSMQPNFADGQRIIVSRLHYLFGEPARGDIVIFNSPASRPGDPPLIKRVIGLPGETIEIRETLVYVNGSSLNEPYINEPCSVNRCRDEVWQLGPEEYFLMGDNRNNSRDSRSFGPVAADALIGEALLRYWPPSDWGLVLHIAFPGR